MIGKQCLGVACHGLVPETVAAKVAGIRATLIHYWDLLEDAHADVRSLASCQESKAGERARRAFLTWNHQHVRNQHMEAYPNGMNQGNIPPIPPPSGVASAPSGEASWRAFDQGAGAPVAQSAAPVAPMSDKPRHNSKRIALVIVACVILAVVGVLGVTIANWTRTPEAKVREYLELLAAGKASAATAMVDPDLANEEREFLTDEVMAAASSRLEIEEIEAADSGRSKDYAVVATMRLNGERFTHLFQVSQGSSTLGVLKNWKIQNSLVSGVNVSGRHVPGFSIGGVKSNKTWTETGGTTVMLYPGVYTFTAEDLGEYVQADANTVAVTASEDGSEGASVATVYFKATFTEKMEQAALDAAVAATNSCGSVPGNIDKICPPSVQSKTLTLLEVKKLPTSMKPAPRGADGYYAEVVFRLQETPGWLDTKPYDLETDVSVNASFDDKGKLKLDASGKPEFDIEFGTVAP